MKPVAENISIDKKNKELIISFLDEVVIYQKKTLKKWAEITAQSPAAKIGYIGQHLASLITGIPGTRSGARGDDLADGTEVKSCNKVDQADKCRKCRQRVLRNQLTCPSCGSTDIERKDDSKWLFSVRDEKEKLQYLELERVLLILMDYPNFENNDFKDIRISAFEIYPKETRMKVFGELIANHYDNIYRPKADKGKKTNPMNLHPFSFQFYKCNPIQTFECIIKDIDNAPDIEIRTIVSPFEDRSAAMPTIPMPTSLLRAKEWKFLLEKVDFEEQIVPNLLKQVSYDDLLAMPLKQKCIYLPYLNEELRDIIPLREIKSVTQKNDYKR